ncbi:MAG: GerAB/ArcD/ProY family transporter [Oscillospiraceae bacterium]|jgi:spore germination protein KB
MYTEKIRRGEFFFLTFCHLLQYLSILHYTDRLARNDTWLVIIIGYFLSIPFILIYTSLAKRFPSKNLLEIFTLVFGKIIGTIILILYLAFFIYVVSRQLDDISGFFTTTFQPETPPILFELLAVIASAVILATGIEHLAKLCFIFALTAAFFIISTVLLLIQDMDFSNFLPILRHEPSSYLKSIIGFAFIPGSYVLFQFLLTPQLESTKKLTELTLAGYSMGVLFLLIVVLRNTATLGYMSDVVISASFSAARVINVGKILTRIDFAISTNIMVMILVTICIYYYGAAKALAQLFGLKSFKCFIIPCGIAALILSSTLFQSSVEHIEFSRIYNLPALGVFSLAFPPAALLVARLRGLKDAAGSGGMPGSSNSPAAEASNGQE